MHCGDLDSSCTRPQRKAAKASPVIFGVVFQKSMLKRKGEQAASLRVAEQWVSAWKEMAKKSNTLIAPWVYYLGEGVVARRTSRFQGITQGNYSNRNLQTKQLSLWSLVQHHSRNMCRKSIGLSKLC